MDNNMANDLVQQWVSVVDAQGRERLEARWVSLTMAALLASAA
jgi:hypothetical protein